MSYIRPDFSEEKLQDRKFVSLLYKTEKDGKVSENIDGYLAFLIIDKKPVLERHKIHDDRLILATLKSGEVLYVDTNGMILREFPKNKKMIADFNEFFDYYIAIIGKQLPDYKNYLPEYKDIHKRLQPLTPKQVDELNVSIRRIIKIPKQVALVYDRNAFTYYSTFDEPRKRMVITYPTVTYYFLQYPEIIKAGIKHEMGHILNGDIFVRLEGHSQCLNVCMDARINMHIPHKDLDELTRCLFKFENKPSISYVNAKKFYTDIHLPVVEGGYSWETAHSHYHLFDKEGQGGSCAMPGVGSGQEGEEMEGGDCPPEILDKINEIFGDHPDIGDEDEGEEGEGGGGEGDEEGKKGEGQGEGKGKGEGEKKDGEGKSGEGQTGGKSGEATKESRKLKQLDKLINKTIATLNTMKQKL